MSVVSLSSPARAALAPGRSTWKPFFWYSAMLLLLTLQLVSGTDFTFAILVFGFCLLTYLAVRACGGLFTLSGLCIFYLACQHVLVSQVAKIAYWQPADSLLSRPVETIAVYDMGMLGLWLGCLFAGRIARLRKRPFFDILTDQERLFWLACIATGLGLFQIVYTATQTFDESTGQKNLGGIHGLFYTLTFLPPLGVAAGTAYTILSTKGKRSLGLINGIAISLPSILGILNSSREAMMTCIVIYFVTCFFFRLKFRPIHYTILIVGAYVAQFILFPYSLNVRHYNHTPSFEKNVQVSLSFLGDVIVNPGKYQKLQSSRRALGNMRHLYYSAGNTVPYGTLDRYSLIATADGIVEGTLTNGTIEMATITPGFEMAIPRIFAPDKGTGVRNDLAHRTKGLVGPKDYISGITVGFIADAFSSFGWIGAMVIPFLLAASLFGAYRLLLAGPLWNNVYAISLIFYLAWQFSEGAIAPIVMMILQGVVVNLAAIFVISLLTDAFSGIVFRIRKASRREGRRPTVELALQRSLSPPSSLPKG